MAGIKRWAREHRRRGVGEKKRHRAIYRSSTGGGAITRLSTINVAIPETAWMRRVESRREVTGVLQARCHARVQTGKWGEGAGANL